MIVGTEGCARIFQKRCSYTCQHPPAPHPTRRHHRIRWQRELVSKQTHARSRKNKQGRWERAGHHQREGTGLLEYQAMPSLRDVAHVGWSCTLKGLSHEID